MRCLDKRYPIRALLDFTQQPAATPVAVEPTPPAAPVAVSLKKPGPITRASDASKEPADRLRALNKIIEDGLITKDDYVAKKKEILGGM